MGDGNPSAVAHPLMFLKPGDRLKINLNRGMVIQSGNDASIALAEHVAGSQETFVDLMNTYAANLGLKNTRFKNSTWSRILKGSTPQHKIWRY